MGWLAGNLARFSASNPARPKGLAAPIEQHPVLLSRGAVEELHPAVG